MKRRYSWISQDTNPMSSTLFRNTFKEPEKASSQAASTRKPADIKEDICSHAYNDLLEFILDFRKNCNGRPTKRMMNETRDWDPNFDLKKATHEQRLAWRGDTLVKKYVVDKRYNLGIIDWLNEKQSCSTITGLNNLARAITSLAAQEENVEAIPTINVHTVFLLQFIVDSMTGSRGWTPTNMTANIALGSPALDFAPM